MSARAPAVRVTERPDTWVGWLHLGAVYGEQSVGAAGPDLHRPVVGVGDPDPDPLAGSRRYPEILGLAIDGPNTPVRVRDR